MNKLEDIKYYKENAAKILRDNMQYATAKATEEAFDTLIWLIEAMDALVEAQNNLLKQQF